MNEIDPKFNLKRKDIKRILEDNLYNDRVPMPILQSEHTPDMKMVAIFLNENFKLGGETDNKTLRSKFSAWCIEKRQKPLTDKIFKKIMYDLGFRIKEPVHPVWQNIH